MASHAAASLIRCKAYSLTGPYCICVPKPPTGKVRVDRDLYDRGQKIFNGKTTLVAPAAKPEEETARLTRLQSMLPKRTAKKTDLPSLAGRLSSEQIEALEYYVQVRFGQIK